MTNFERLKAEAPLLVEETPRLYVYRLRMGGHAQTGLAGCFSVDDYDRDVIRKHEHTRRDKEDDRTRHLLELAGADGAGVPDLSREAGDRWTGRANHDREAALRLHGR